MHELPGVLVVRRRLRTHATRQHRGARALSLAAHKARMAWSQAPLSRARLELSLGGALGGYGGKDLRLRRALVQVLAPLRRQHQPRVGHLLRAQHQQRISFACTNKSAELCAKGATTACTRLSGIIDTTAAKYGTRAGDGPLTFTAIMSHVSRLFIRPTTAACSTPALSAKASDSTGDCDSATARSSRASSPSMPQAQCTGRQGLHCTAARYLWCLHYR